MTALRDGLPGGADLQDWDPDAAVNVTLLAGARAVRAGLAIAAVGGLIIAYLPICAGVSSLTSLDALASCQ